MKIRGAHPNSAEFVTGIIMEPAKSKGTKPTTEIMQLKNPKGIKNIDCGFDDYQSVWSFIRHILEVCESAKIDAVVLAGFGHVVVYALKEALNIPVLSIA